MSSVAVVPHHKSAPRPAPDTWCFAVQGEASSALMVRVLELFAKRSLTPIRCYCNAAPGSAELSMDIQVAEIDRDLAGYIARCMRQVVGVSSVLISPKS